MGGTRLVSFLVMFLIQAPGRQKSSLWVRSGWHIGPSVPHRREHSMTAIHIFFSLDRVGQDTGDRLITSRSSLEGEVLVSLDHENDHENWKWLLNGITEHDKVMKNITIT